MSILQEELEYTIDQIERLREQGFRQVTREERLILALLLIANDTYAIRGMIESLLLALSDLQNR
jgi:hypothetical protein